MNATVPWVIVDSEPVAHVMSSSTPSNWRTAVGSTPGWTPAAAPVRRDRTGHSPGGPRHGPLWTATGPRSAQVDQRILFDLDQVGRVGRRAANKQVGVV